MDKIKRFKLYMLRLTNISRHIDIPAAKDNIRRNIYFRGPNVWILAFSIVIASVGLNVNSIPVIIGAMLISPLMGPIFGIGLGLGINDTRLIRDSFRNLGIMILISIVASCVYFLISPLDLENPTELLARTNPTIYDVLIALFGGFAGIFEIARKDKGTVFSGVAIATALMPPLCTAGYGLASGNLMYFLGAFYLFFINCSFITLATYFSVRYMRFPSVSFTDPKKKKKAQRIISVFVIIIIVPSVLSAISVIKQNRFDTSVRQFIEDNKSLGKNYIYAHDISHHNGSKLEIFIAGAPLTTSEKDELYRRGEEYGIMKDQLVITENTGNSEYQANEELIKGLYDITNDEIRKREQLIKELEEELKNIHGSEIQYSQIARELVAQVPDITGLAILKGSRVNTEDYSADECIYILLSTDRGKKIDTEKIARWLSIRLNCKDLKLLQVDKPVLETADTTKVTSQNQPK